MPAQWVTVTTAVLISAIARRNSLTETWLVQLSTRSVMERPRNKLENGVDDSGLNSGNRGKMIKNILFRYSSRYRRHARLAFFKRLKSLLRWGQESGERPEIHDMGDLLMLLIEDARWRRDYKDVEALHDVAQLYSPQDNIHVEIQPPNHLGAVYYGDGGVPIAITIDPAELWWASDEDEDTFLWEFTDTCWHEVLHVLFSKEGIIHGHHFAIERISRWVYDYERFRL